MLIYVLPALQVSNAIPSSREFGQSSHERDRFNRATADHISSQFIRCLLVFERNFRSPDRPDRQTQLGRAATRSGHRGRDAAAVQVVCIPARGMDSRVALNAVRQIRPRRERREFTDHVSCRLLFNPLFLPFSSFSPTTAHTPVKNVVHPSVSRRFCKCPRRHRCRRAQGYIPGRNNSLVG